MMVEKNNSQAPAFCQGPSAADGPWQFGYKLGGVMILPSSFHFAVMGSNSPLSDIALIPALNFARSSVSSLRTPSPTPLPSTSSSSGTAPFNSQQLTPCSEVRNASSATPSAIT